MTLKGAAHSWSMGFAIEAPPAGDAEAELRLLTPAGLHDPAEGVAFALWNEGRKDEAIEFLERQIAREREPGGGHSVPPKGRAAFRAVGAGAFAIVLIAAGAALWVNWDEAAGFFGRTTIARPQAEVREDPLAAAEKDIQSAPELAEVAPEVEVRPEVDAISEAAQDTVPGPADGSADVREIALWEPAAPVNPVPMQDSATATKPDPQPEADVAEAFTAATEVEPEEDADLGQASVIQAEPEPEAGAVLAEGSAALAEPEPEVVPEIAQAGTDAQPERQAPLDHLRVAAALQAGAQMAAAEVETQSSPPAEAAPQSPAPAEPVATLDAVASADPVEPEGGPRAGAEPAPPVLEARLPRARPARPERASAMAEAPARAAVVAAADNPPPVEALVPVLPMHPEPYPPMVFEPAPLPPELAYNRARAERYLAMRRAMAERRAGGSVYVTPPPRYGELEIIGRVPGW